MERLHSSTRSNRGSQGSSSELSTYVVSHHSNINTRTSRSYTGTWRNYSQYQSWAQVMLERIHVCATLKLDQVVTNVVDGVSRKLARHAMQTRIRRKLRDLRDRIRAQAHVRTMIARFNFRELQKRLEIVRQASYVVFERGSISQCISIESLSLVRKRILLQSQE